MQDIPDWLYPTYLKVGDNEYLQLHLNSFWFA